VWRFQNKLKYSNTTSTGPGFGKSFPLPESEEVRGFESYGKRTARLPPTDISVEMVDQPHVFSLRATSQASPKMAVLQAKAVLRFARLLSDIICAPESELLESC
jgi:hypothetical protein